MNQPNTIPPDVLHTVWVIELSSETTKKHLLDAFSPVAPVKDALVTEVKGKYVALLEFQSLEGKRSVLRQASEGEKFTLEDGSKAVVRDARTSIRLFLQAQQQQQQQQPRVVTQQQSEASAAQQKAPAVASPADSETELVDMTPKSTSSPVPAAEQATKPQNPRFREEIQPKNTTVSNNSNQGTSAAATKAGDLRAQIRERLDTNTIRQDMQKDSMTQHQLGLIEKGMGKDSELEIKKCHAANIDSLPPFEDHQVTQLQQKIENTIFSSDKLALVKEVATAHSFSCQQVKSILSSFRISFEQKQLLTEYFFKHIRDQGNIDNVLESFEFDMDREIVKKMLHIMAETSVSA